jgi:hypothetical protein
MLLVYNKFYRHSSNNSLGVAIRRKEGRIFGPPPYCYSTFHKKNTLNKYIVCFPRNNVPHYITPDS